jgi:hypothetical protein
MADVFANRGLISGTFGVTSPYGNVTAKAYTVETDSSGVLIGGSQTTVLASGDIVVMGIIPAGTIIWPNISGSISNAGTASTTARIGIRPTDGVPTATAPNDDDYLLASRATSATGLLNAPTAVAPVKLSKDCYITVTIGGANHTSDFRMDFIILMVVDGRDSFV